MARARPGTAAKSESSGVLYARVPTSLKAALQRLANDRGISDNQLIIEALEEFIGLSDRDDALAAMEANLAGQIEATMNRIFGHTSALHNKNLDAMLHLTGEQSRPLIKARMMEQKLYHNPTPKPTTPPAGAQK
ncbi:toxin-antitoxin system HicB family antitoxin [Cupriavidus metallidurans]|uniref:toxin-antitoxin system HicB family antitoxin n=1 Tax=Cupriavidus metallidurans TaxID=119219 RepID=UPI000CE0651F|nr:toxin-antitoxin system HicB family antitoxin [Cupriavidus metallidurans]AVA32601.1 hypothetical protein C3Z06_02625 [Cupriavidus metallidurans]